MEIQTSKNHYYQISWFWPIFNFLLFIYIWTIASMIFVTYFTIKEGLTANDNLFYLLFIVVFLILGIKQRYGNFYAVYKSITKKEWLSKVLGELHIIPAIIYFFLIILTKGEIIRGELLNLSVIFFIISYILLILILVKQGMKGGK